ncbi:hypothetical protein C1E24_10830 [Pseudoalteromonas phenolica]|uniref:Uncharacterized protein n=1 Tax=Pseudoalteromonas phenolica TaxID=161398 RepID=A0A5R9Q242_9GAMM|nr:hypothetical protein C1E24_10830 [Pseudoalteromonas phenolica]
MSKSQQFINFRQKKATLFSAAFWGVIRFHFGRVSKNQRLRYQGTFLLKTQRANNNLKLCMKSLD